MSIGDLARTIHDIEKAESMFLSHSFAVKDQERTIKRFIDQRSETIFESSLCNSLFLECFDYP